MATRTVMEALSEDTIIKELINYERFLEEMLNYQQQSYVKLEQ